MDTTTGKTKAHLLQLRNRTIGTMTATIMKAGIMTATIIIGRTKVCLPHLINGLTIITIVGIMTATISTGKTKSHHPHLRNGLTITMIPFTMTVGITMSSNIGRTEEPPLPIQSAIP